MIPKFCIASEAPKDLPMEDDYPVEVVGDYPLEVVDDHPLEVALVLQPFVILIQWMNPNQEMRIDSYFYMSLAHPMPCHISQGNVNNSEVQHKVHLSEALVTHFIQMRILIFILWKIT